MRKTAFFCVLLAMLFLFSSCVIKTEEPLKEEKAPVFPERKTGCFLFSETEFEEGNAVLKTAEEILNYTPEWAEYDSSIYYDTLDDGSRLIYRAFQYALDNSFETVLISEELKERASRRPPEILEFLSLDSAHLEQNLVDFSQGKERFLVTGARYYGGEESTPLVEGYRMHIPSFSKALEAKRRMSLEFVLELDLGIRDGMNEFEKAQKIFRWLGENVVYEETANTDFLYQAVIRQKTICDGYANAFQLLCGINGIECYEKMTDFTQLGIVEGHTWNAAKLDGVWYNIDPTAAPNTYGPDGDDAAEWGFAYSDEAETGFTAFSDLLPQSTGNAVCYLGHFNSLQDDAFFSEIQQNFGKRKERVVCVTLEPSEITQDKFNSAMDRLVNKLNFGFSTSVFEGERRDKVFFFL